MALGTTSYQGLPYPLLQATKAIIDLAVWPVSGHASQSIPPVANMIQHEHTIAF